jgi:AcrR family transcriptional regulator
MNTSRLQDVLDATYSCIVRFGVRRTTMDDIAQAAGMSRSALYQYVRSKDDAVRKVAERLHDRATQRATAAAMADVPPAMRVQGILQAKLDLVLELAGDSPNAAELLDAKTRLYGDVCTGFTDRVESLLVEVFTEAGTSDVSPKDAAAICVALVVGLEHAPYNARLLPPAVRVLTEGLLASGHAPVTVSS